MTNEVTVNRYRVSIKVERLIDVDGHTSPETGRVEEHNRQIGEDGPWVAVVPEWVEVAAAAGNADAPSLRDAWGEVLNNLGEMFQKIEEMVDLIDKG